MKKLIKSLIDVNYLRKIWGFSVLSDAVKNNFRLKIIDNIDELIEEKNCRILVISPHPDDDVFGCGGILAKHAAAGQMIASLYLCDGSCGTPDGKRDIKLIKIRANESKNSSKILGITDNIFWKFQDGKLTANKTAINALVTMINKLTPHLIYIPSIIDNHADHRAAGEILIKTIEKINKISQYNPFIVQYEIWTTIYPNRIINITREFKIKKLAMQAHKSQLQSRAYDLAMDSLNSYRGQINNIDGQAEALLLTSYKIFSKLYKLVNR